jgi:replicative DNA helicase
MTPTVKRCRIGCFGWGDRTLPSSSIACLPPTAGLLCWLVVKCSWGFATVSETLARQVQHLLLRFGIIARLKARSVKYQATRRPAWQLDITDARAIKTFIDTVGIFGKEDALLQATAALSQRRYQTNRDLVPVEVWERLRTAKGHESWQAVATRAGFTNTSNLHVGKRALGRDRLFALASVLEDQALQAIATSDVYWDEIVDISPQGTKQVYDLTIPDTHNFFANDICVHNTSFVLNMARNIAAGQKLPVAIFSLEMSKQQLVYRLLSSEVAMETSRLRTGRIAQHEWEMLGQAISTLSQFPVYIDDTPNISVIEMRSKARRLQAEQGGRTGARFDRLPATDGGGQRQPGAGIVKNHEIAQGARPRVERAHHCPVSAQPGSRISHQQTPDDE